MLISTEGLPRQTVVLGHLLLVAVAAWLCGDLAVRAIELRWLAPKAPSPPPASAPARTPWTAQGNSYRAMIDRNLFGVLVREAPPPVAAVAQPELTPVKSAQELGLSLRGTVAGPDAVAFAIFGKIPNQELYRIGDEVSPGVFLESIGYGEVVLRRGTERLQLTIDDEGGGNAVGRRVGSRVVPRPTPTQPQAESSGVREVAPNSYLVERDTVTESLATLSNLMKDIRVVPSFDEAKQPNGYRVASIRFGSLLDKLGVKRGDIVQTINGLPISDPDRAYQAYQQFKEETSVQVEVVRGGKPITLTYEIQ